jgi:formate hydrogenlyase transcriptional activator
MENVTIQSPTVPRERNGSALDTSKGNAYIEDRKGTEQALRRIQFYLSEGQRLAHMGSWALSAAGFDYWSPEMFQIYGLDPGGRAPTVREYLELVPPEDRKFIQEKIQQMLGDRLEFDFTKRILRPDGEIRYVRCAGSHLVDGSGFQGLVGTAMDVTEQEQLTQDLRRNQYYLAEGQRLSRTGSFSWCVQTDEIIWSEQLYRIYEFDLSVPLTLERIGSRVHPDDLPLFEDMIEKARNAAEDFEYHHRLLMPDQSVKHIHLFAHATRDKGGRVEYIGAAQDVTDLHTITDAIPIAISILAPDGKPLYVNRMALDRVGVTLEEVKSRGHLGLTCHPDDLDQVLEKRSMGLLGDVLFAVEMRLLRDGEFRWHLVEYNPLKDESGRVIRWYVTATDIDDRKRAEQELRRSEAELLTITDSIANPIAVLAPDGSMLYANQVTLNQSGLNLSEAMTGFYSRICHPDDIEQALHERGAGLAQGVPFELEMRLLKNGEHRWHLTQYNPRKDERGQIIRWYVTATDVEDQKRTEERLRNDNVRLDQERVYLEEQIRSEMGFEQIIGNSLALKHVLELVKTVALSDSTVLLLGETGTGKELIARAVHEHSRRSAKTFVKLNCAAIPTGLLESELFGHEKGAFTGAIIQKVGRMELADQGTLFLDEVGDIPIDIQPKLLRALQEREFERLGSIHTRKVNVRLVAATNCNLEKMVAEKAFRSDLFYRLNVFPIRIPPLRERKEDIPLLVAYFVQKFAKQMQKRIDSIPVATMKALRAWDWPGNIRELENFIERAVILTRGDSLAAPLSELRNVTINEPARKSAPTEEGDIARIVRETIASLKEKTPESEHAKRQHEEIVRMVTECKGRVGGPDGAAARMGLSRTTLISRMKKLGINPYDCA